MNEAADAANPLGDVDELDVILLLDQFLQPPMDKANGRARLDHFLIFNHQVEMDRLRQNRMLRAKRNDGAGHGLVAG